MSYINTKSPEFISAKVTQKGRRGIANGNFKISYFQVGDSEFDYNTLFTSLTGVTNHQMVLAPFDKESGVKYPYKLADTEDFTTYGVPINRYTGPEPIRNVMGPAGFVTNYAESGETIVKCHTEVIPFSSVNGTSFLTVASGNTFNGSKMITLVFSEFGGVDPEEPLIVNPTNSLVYKIIGITGTTIELDRVMPDLSSFVGNLQVVSNYCELESYDATGFCPPISNDAQHNPWSLNIVWGDQRPIGVNNAGLESSVSGYTSNKYVSSKELLGYTSDSQTFETLAGDAIVNPTSYVNSFGEIINVPPEEQRVIGIIHYSEMGILLTDPERFFKYDDYISTLTGTTESSISLVDDEEGIPLSDNDYFEVYIPFILYHRNTGTTIGAVFHMDTTDYYLNSTINDRHSLLYRYLLDEQNIRVGKVFPNNKIIVIDDQELLAILDIRSNRKWTLGAPKVSLIPSDTIPEDSVFSGGTGNTRTLWVTYMLSNEIGEPELNSLPCNYFCKVDDTAMATNVTVKFSGNTFQHMNTSYSGLTDGFIAKQFHILAQETAIDQLPSSDLWIRMDYTTEADGDGVTYLNPAKLIDVSFIITKNRLDNGTLFSLDEFMGSGYTSILKTQFGEEQPFPGSIRLVRASDIEQLKFEINLPSTQFKTTQNPTFNINESTKTVITEIALLDDNKEPLVIAKLSPPIERLETQNFMVKIDF